MPKISPDHARLIARLETIAPLNDADRAALAELPLRLASVAENRDIVRAGAQQSECCLVVQGVLARYKMLGRGRRQIMSFHFSGDIPDIESLYLDVADHSICAFTAARVAFVPHAAIRALVRRQPGVDAALGRQARIEASIGREWIANMGRRTALERIAHLLCECFARLRALELVQGLTFDLPLTQNELGDATGLSTVHVNRTLKELGRRGLIKSARSQRTILDWTRLASTADFDAAYLHLRPRSQPDT